MHFYILYSWEVFTICLYKNSELIHNIICTDAGFESDFAVLEACAVIHISDMSLHLLTTQLRLARGSVLQIAQMYSASCGVILRFKKLFLAPEETNCSCIGEKCLFVSLGRVCAVALPLFTF